MVGMVDETSDKKGCVGGLPIDTFMDCVSWTKNRMVIIYHRLHAGKEYIRLRTFHRHQVKGCWYPAQRFYMIPLASARELGNAIIAAGRGKSSPMPEWYADFEKQYNERAWQKQDDSCEVPEP